jgi:GNAT superfamily N-acetyltransferase
MPDRLHIRPAAPGEREALEALQLRSSRVHVQYRRDLDEHPEAIALTPGAIEESRVRVATAADGTMVGFAEWSVSSAEEWELEGLFVEPTAMRRGIGTRLLRDVIARAITSDVGRIGVVAEPAAVEFYERLGFSGSERAQTRFGPAFRMWLILR